jgi:hypothetical protein
MIKTKYTLLLLAGFLVVILGLVGYFLYNNNIPLTPAKDPVTTSLNKQSSEDDSASIEKDLQDTDTDSINSDLDSLEKEVAQ